MNLHDTSLVKSSSLSAADRLFSNPLVPAFIQNSRLQHKGKDSSWFPPQGPRYAPNADHLNTQNRSRALFSVALLAFASMFGLNYERSQIYWETRQCVCVAGGVGVRGSCPVVRAKATDFYKLIGQWILLIPWRLQFYKLMKQCVFFIHEDRMLSSFKWNWIGRARHAVYFSGHISTL